MVYMTVREAGEKWGLGIRIVTLYCAEGRIEGDFYHISFMCL